LIKLVRVYVCLFFFVSEGESSISRSITTIGSLNYVINLFDGTSVCQLLGRSYDSEHRGHFFSEYLIIAICQASIDVKKLFSMAFSCASCCAEATVNTVNFFSISTWKEPFTSDVIQLLKILAKMIGVPKT
jgi:hypothetical protein